MDYGEAHNCLHSLGYGDGASAHWGAAHQDVLGEEGGTHTTDLVAPMLYGEVEDEDDEEGVCSAPSVYLVTLPVGAQAFHLLAWA